MSDSKGAAIDSEEIWLNILNSLPKEIRELVGKHSVHWNYSKIETLDALSAILAQEVTKARISELVLWFDTVKIADLSLSLEQDMENRLNELKRKAGLV